MDKRSYWNIETKKSTFFPIFITLYIWHTALQFLMENFASKVVYPSLIELK